MTDWPHAPLHRLEAAGAYMVTGATYLKAPLFHSPNRLTLLRDSLFHLARHYGWSLQAWAIMSNHYHFVAISPHDATNLRKMIRHLHSITAREVNRLDGSPDRQVWHQYWDTHLTYQNSYYARLNYVHQNPVHHRLVSAATAYPWCSAEWFERTADPPFQRVIAGFKTDKVKMPDDFA